MELKEILKTLAAEKPHMLSFVAAQQYSEYLKTGDPLDLKSAYCLYEFVAEQGNVEGIVRMLQLRCELLLRYKRDRNIEKLEDLDIGFRRFLMKLEEQYGIGKNPEYLKNKKRYQELSDYVNALLHYKESPEIVRHGEENISIDSEYYFMMQVVMGVSLMRANQDEEGLMYLSVFEEVKMEHILPPNADSMDEEMLIYGIQYLALYYRVKQNRINEARKLLVRALEVTKNEQVQEFAQKMLSHYKPKLFGGYKYVK